MELTRRTFLAVAGSTAALPIVLRAPSVQHVVMLESGSAALADSAGGYWRALAGGGRRVDRQTADGRPALARSADVLILPAVLWLSPDATDRVLDAAWRGARVLVESAAGFEAPEKERTGRRWLHGSFGIRADGGLALWPAVRAADRVPYVDFTGPVTAKVRDFSRVLPLSGPGWQPLARAADTTVGCACPVGRGVVAVLGSPLGPALAYGDREAHRWLTGFLRWQIA